MKLLAIMMAFAIFATALPGGGNVTFVPTALYFLANSGGADGNAGTSTGAAWATPNHAVNCGDEIVVQPGTYSGKFSQNFGTVSNCPSTTGGVGGAGGVYAATLVCAVPFACVSDGIWVNKSNWSVQGFTVSDVSSNAAVAMRATPTGVGTTLAYVLFTNNACTGASLACFYGGGSSDATKSVDEFGLIGNVAFNGSQSSGECGSGLSINTPNAVDSFAGTHIPVIGNYSYGNVNGICGANSGGNGAFSTDNGGTGSGSSTVVVASAAGMVAGYPIGVQNAAGIVISGISQPNWITNVATNTLTLNTVTSGTIANGALIATGLTTDGEGLIFDTWDSNAYAKQAYVAQNVLFGNGGHGLEVFCASTCAAGLAIYLDHNTVYGNLQDYKHSSFGGEFNFNTGASFPGTLSVTNNIVQASVIAPTGSPSTFKNVGGTNVGMGNAVVSALLNPGYVVSGNFFKSAASATCPAGGTCNGASNDVAYFNSANYNSGNTFGTDPGLANTAALPTTAPNCSGQSNVYQCMVAAGVIAAVVPSGGAATLGYQPPGTCAANSKWPTWVNYLVYHSVSSYANGATITLAAGLVTKPCGV